MALIKSSNQNNGRVVVIGNIQDNNIKELLTSHQVEIFGEERTEIDY